MAPSARNHGVERATRVLEAALAANEQIGPVEMVGTRVFATARGPSGDAEAIV